MQPGVCKGGRDVAMHQKVMCVNVTSSNFIRNISIIIETKCLAAKLMIIISISVGQL